MRTPPAVVPEKNRSPERMRLVLREKKCVPPVGSLKTGALAILSQTRKREVLCGQLVCDDRNFRRYKHRG